MLKKSFIIGLVLLLAGVAVYGWLLALESKQQQQTAHYKSKYPSGQDEYLKQYNEWLRTPVEQRDQLPWGLDKNGKLKTAAQLQQEQQEHLKADLDRLAAGEMDIYPFANILYGEDWEKQLKSYKTKKELKELGLTSSIMGMSTGGIIATWSLLVWTARLLIIISSYLKKLFLRSSDNQQNTIAQPLADEVSKEQKDSDQNPDTSQVQSKKQSNVLIDSGWQDFDMIPKRKKRTLGKLESKVASNQHSTNSQTTTAVKACNGSSAESSEEVAVMLAEEEPVKFEKSLKSKKAPIANMTQVAIEHSIPLENSLKELTQEVSAIREYAACQQEKVKRFQDGYDWNIIKNFCLRIIRCIDNLEDRINNLSAKGVKTAYLEEVRDELVFALESSGLERFEPEINSDYRGQEKIAEAVKTKKRCSDEKLTGKIAKVLRQGYRYVIDEKNSKVVRPAQVKLFA